LNALNVRLKVDDTAMLHELMMERMQILEEALTRAESGVASRADWETIRYECGMGVLHKGDSNGIHNKVKRVVM
jgi:hypothetical protein